MVKFLVMGVQTCFNIPKAFPVGKLGEGKAEKLIITGEPSNPMVTVVPFDAPGEFITWQMIQYLRKNCFPGIHPCSSPTVIG
jgi:hypothetical protein